MKINVILDVDEKTILEESGQPSLTEAIGQELGWLRDSGMFVENWSYWEREQGRSGPEELVVRLAHLAGSLEAEKHIGAVEWDDLTVAIHEMVDAYMNDPSESINPFCLEDAAERHFVIQFGLDEFREAAVAEGWSNKSPSELISDAKKNFRTVPDIPEEVLTDTKASDQKDYSYEEDKILYRDKKTGDLSFGDYLGKDDFLSVEGHLLDNPSDFLEVIGVYTSPECIAAVHPCKISALHDEIPADYQDDMGIGVLNSLDPEMLYDVCYYYTRLDYNTLFTGVDRNLKAHEIAANAAKNKYMEGAVIYESQRMLTVDEYIDGMRYNTHECKLMMTQEQLSEVQLGVKKGVPETELLRPKLSPAELLKLRTELETEILAKADPYHYYVATDRGPDFLEHGFVSVSNFKKYPDRVCYVPENWDFEEDGPGITGQEIIDLCGGDKLKARMVFELCDWQHPSTVLGEWDHDDDVALEELRSRQTESVKHSAFTDVLNSAKDRAANQKNFFKGPEPHR